jgi:hypothetical protein
MRLRRLQRLVWVVLGAETCDAHGVCGASTGAPPVVTELYASGAVTDSGSAVVTARVSDPDGTGDIAGGLLRDATTHAVLTSFTGAVGTYTASLSWSLIPASRLTFGPSGATYAVEAVFEDRDSNQASRTSSLTLACGDAGYSACSGDCLNLTSDSQNCGSCGRGVPEGGYCSDGTPTCDSSYTNCGNECAYLEDSVQHCGACNNNCASWAATRSLTPTFCSSPGTCIAIATATYAVSCNTLCAQHGASCFTGGAYPDYNIEIVYQTWGTSYTGDCSVVPSSQICYETDCSPLLRMECTCY